MKEPSATTMLPVCKGAETDRDGNSADEEAAHMLLQLNGDIYGYEAKDNYCSIYQLHLIDPAC